MSLRINTNVAALMAHQNMIKNDNRLTSSLERLSSGLRINKAADDAAGMAIADALRSQALGLGQAIRNASDGISVVQTADGALQESINIINTIKTKAIQAAQDGQTTESRKAIQADISKLMEELDMIAKTTAFNNQKLLSGNFTNKAFQVGAYSGETVSISIASSQSTKVGHVTTGQLAIDDETAGLVQISIYSNLQNQHFLVESVQVAYDNSSEHSMGALADAINKLSDTLGISATAMVRVSTNLNVAAGITESNFAINGVTIGSLEVKANDSDGAFVKAINNKTSQHGVMASVDTAGRLTLTSVDNRAIQVTATSITDQTGGVYDIVRGTDLTTLGYVQLNQTGSSEIIVTDVGGGNVVALTNNLEFDGDVTTTIDSTLASGSVISDGSTLEAGWTTSQILSGATFDAALVTTEASTLTTGSVLGSGSIVASGSVLGGLTTIEELVGTSGEILTLAIGSTLESGSVIGSGTTLTNNITISGEALTGVLTVASGSTLVSGAIIGSGTTLTFATTIDVLGTGGATDSGTISLAAGTVLASGTQLGSGQFLNTVESGLVYGSGWLSGATHTLDSGANQTFDTAASGLIAAGSTLAAGSIIGSGDIDVKGDQVTAGSLILQSGSDLQSGSILAAGSIVGVDDIHVQGDQTTTAVQILQMGGTTLISGSILAADSIIGADDITLRLDSILTESMALATDSTLAQAGTSFAAGSTVGADAVLAIDLTVTGANGMAIELGTILLDASTLANGSTLGGAFTLLNDETVSATGDMYIAAGSTLADGSVIAAGTYLTQDVVASGGITYTAGTVLVEAITLSGDQTLDEAMTVQNGSVLVAGSTLAATTGQTASATSEMGSTAMNRLSDLNVLSQAQAQIAIAVADAALKDLGNVRSALGSVQNQLTATISNLATTQVNIYSAESNVRDVDFAEEAGIFGKMQILSQAGVFALAQANASAQLRADASWVIELIADSS